jgi:V8-like Glu-specific endopeptidase
MIVQSIPRNPTQPGDSGSPVVNRAGDGILLGMHVAGVDNGEGNRFAYMIPAWQLFDPRNYNGAANSEEWKIFNS